MNAKKLLTTLIRLRATDDPIITLQYAISELYEMKSEDKRNRVVNRAIKIAEKQLNSMLTLLNTPS